MSQSIKGTYVFKQNGIEIGRSSNLITANGRTMILQYLSSARQDWASDMAIGAMPTNTSGQAPLSTDIQLNFETGRYPVALKTFIAASGSNPDLILVRSTLPANISANIYEVGLYAVSNSAFSTSTRNNIFLTDFSNLSSWSLSSGTVVPNTYIPQGYSSPRIGSNSISLSSSTTYYNSSTNIPFAGYTPLDSLQILAFNTTAGTISVTLTDISGVSQTVVFTTNANSGYSVLSTKFDTTTSGSNYSSIINFSNIKGISISTDSSTYATIDAIKVSSANEISIEETLVSKSVLSNPIPKTPNVPLDVEYYVELL